LAGSLLHDGPNVLEFWTDAAAMNAWSLAIEPGHAQPESFASDDGGATWRNERMAYLNAVRGEYVVRVRLDAGDDPPPPAPVWERPTNPRVAHLRQILPAPAAAPGRLMDRVRALTSWLSTSWEHTGSALASQYAPWDAPTILAWGSARAGHAGQRPIAMCVHYAVSFVSACQAAGIAARCAPITGAINGFDGHFVAEVWFDEYGKWVAVDPNVDAVFWRDNTPLSLPEIQGIQGDLGPCVEWGPGSGFQRRNPRLAAWLETTYLPGHCFRHRSVWPRADFLTHPELTPPGHGTTPYCETALVWEARDRARGFGMFPFFAPPSYFVAPPPIVGPKDLTGLE
jgi:hypothetical protein